MPFKKVPPLYTVWQGMLGRCRNKNFKQWKDYGGRGISVCDRWKNSFENFVADMGPRPAGYTLDRINNNGDYEPSNCKWSTRKEQQHNQTVTVKVIIENKSYVAVEIAKKHGFKTDTIIKRAALGLSFEEVTSKKRRVYKEGLALGGQANGARNRAKTHCSNGHEFTEKNTYYTKEGWRNCRLCRTVAWRA